MKANEQNLMMFLSLPNTRFVIPVYQRNYDWKKEQCKQLLDDIIECGRNDQINAHFLGSIVYILGGVFAAARNTLTIIDGQQRLTTITLLLIVIYKLAQQLGQQDIAEKVYLLYLVNQFLDKTLKLKLTDSDDKVLHSIIGTADIEEYRDYSRLLENYEYLRSRVSGMDLDIVLEGLNKLMFVEISLNRDNDDPQRIFESLNSTGLALSQADLIRNYILMGLEPEDQRRVYAEYWQPIERLAKEEATNKSSISNFIRDYLTIKNKRIPNEQKVYQEFKNTFEWQDLAEFEPELQKLKQYVTYYNKLLNIKKELDLDIRQQLKNINRLKVNVSYPFLLQLYHDFTEKILSRQEFVEVLSLVESFVWRRAIVQVPTNQLNTIFMRLYEDIDLDDYVNSLAQALAKKKRNRRFPTDREIQETLKEREVYRLRNIDFLLENLENFQNNEPVRIEDNPKITIEHIFPQNPAKEWREEVSADDYQELGEVYLHTLGNLTLSGNNGSLGNKIFREKRDLPEKGYRDSRLYLNRYLSALDTWGVLQLKERNEILTERFLQIWPYPNVHVEADDDFEEVNIFDAEDPTDKNLEYAIFRDEKLPCTTVTDLYIDVLKRLFDLEPKHFFGTDLARKVKITKEKTELRAPKPINDIYYIESNLGSSGKFERLKEALEIFECEDELSVKYAPEIPTITGNIAQRPLLA